MKISDYIWLKFVQLSYSKILFDTVKYTSATKKQNNTKNPAVNCDLTEYFLQLNKFSPVLAYMTHHSQSQWLCPISSASSDFH